MQVDIIGGGLSGLATAISLKQHASSIEVFVHEKHKKIGFNHDARKCGEAHCIESFSLKWKPPAETIASPVYHGISIAGKKTIKSDRTPDTAWILDRPKYIAYLGKQAKQLGVEFVLNDRIIDPFSLSADVIVDASGCPSIVKKRLGIHHRFVGIGYQETIEHCSAFKSFTPKLTFEQHGGYYWVFPRHPEKKEVNVGVAMLYKTDIKLPPLLKAFKEKENIKGLVNYTAGGLIPGGLQFPLRHKHIIFVGDAGVGTLPINGQGIYRALLSGDIAGKYIAQNDLRGYVHRIIRDFIKMDIVGKSYLRCNKLLSELSSELVVSSWNWYQSINDRINFFKSEYDTIH